MSQGILTFPRYKKLKNETESERKGRNNTKYAPRKNTVLEVEPFGGQHNTKISYRKTEEHSKDCSFKT